MRCPEVRSLLSEYLDGALSERRAFRVQAHLDTCASCDSRWHSLLQTVRVVGSMGREACPFDLRQSVMRAVAMAGPPAHRAPGMTWRAMLGGFAAVGAASLAIVLAPVIMPRAAVPETRALTAVAVQVSLHDQYDLASSLGTADGLFLSLPVRPKEPAAIAPGPSRLSQSAN